MSQAERKLFTTERLRVRGFEFTDLEALAAINASPSVSRYVDDGKPLSRAETAHWIRDSRNQLARFGYGTGAVIHRTTGRLIGWTGFARGTDPTDLTDEEIIYGLDEPWWGQGYGGELVTALVAYGLDAIGLPLLRATVYRQNHASVRILHRQGFQLKSRDYKGERGLDLYLRER